MPSAIKRRCRKNSNGSKLGDWSAREGKRVLLVDVDAQGSLTASLGYQQPDLIEVTLATIMGQIITDDLYNEEGADLLPANIKLSGMEVTLVNTMSRETILRDYLKKVCDDYDVVILDCCPSLAMLRTGVNHPFLLDHGNRMLDKRILLCVLY